MKRIKFNHQWILYKFGLTLFCWYLITSYRRTLCMNRMKELHKAHELWHCLIYKGLCNTFYCKSLLFYIDDALPFTSLQNNTQTNNLMIYKIWRLRLYSLTSIELWLCGFAILLEIGYYINGKRSLFKLFSWLLHDFYVSLDIIMRWAGTYIAITCASYIKVIVSREVEKVILTLDTR